MSVLELDREVLYGILRTRDRRFDGRLFVGVSSTRIYCRPICTVRPPRIENFSFHLSAAAAEHAGFRPCLRCRPELAPGSVAPVDAVPRLAALAIRRIEDGALSGHTIDEFAAEFGVTARHLRRSVVQETGLTPIEFAQTQRLLLAKQLLTDTRMSITEAAFAAGFESLRRFNTAFKARYRLTPSELRRESKSFSLSDCYEFDLVVRAQFDLAAQLAFWSTRAIAGVESVNAGWYYRTATVAGCVGWVAIGPPRKPYTVHVRISNQLGPVMSKVLACLKAMLDVRADPTEIGMHLSVDPLLKTIIDRSPALRLPGAFDGFECGVRAVLGQQISVRAATTLAGRIALRFGQPQQTAHAGLTQTFPTAAVIASAAPADLVALGLTTRRAETIVALANSIEEGRIHLESGVDPELLRAELLKVPGIGEWTAEYLLLRTVGWPDAFPVGDLGLIRASGLSKAELRLRSERWRPWRAYAAILLWQSLHHSPSSNRNASSE